MTQKELIKELYKLSDIAFLLNNCDYTRTEFTRKISSCMGTIIQDMQSIQWHHVDKCLPVDGRKVLVYSGNKFCEIHIGWIEKGTWYDDSGEYSKDVVTHWRYLPLEPEE